MELKAAITSLGLSDSELPTLSRAIDDSDRLIEDARAWLSNRHGDLHGVDVVACGSLARREFSPASDIDYLVIVADLPGDHHAHRNLLGHVASWVKEKGAEPGQSGLFGGTVGAFDMIEKIGLQDDTNFSHSRRMELLLESVSLLSQQVHELIVGSTIDRYLSIEPEKIGRPPRFLINDFLRYWRTITVDYQAKNAAGIPSEKAVLRYVKLVLTRKCLIASSLLPLILYDAPSGGTRDADTEYFKQLFSMPTLSRLAFATTEAPEEIKDNVRTVFRSIESFLTHTATEEAREHLKSIDWESRLTDEVYRELRSAADQLQSAFEHIYTDWPKAFERTKSYLLF